MITLDWTLGVASVVFLITLISLNRLLFQPLLRVLDERRARTSDLRHKAQKTLESFQSLFEHYQDKVKQERQAGYKLAEVVRNEALQQRQGKMVETRTQAEQLLAEARAQIEKELVSAQARLRSGAAEIARSITQKVLGRA